MNNHNTKELNTKVLITTDSTNHNKIFHVATFHDSKEEMELMNKYIKNMEKFDPYFKIFVADSFIVIRDNNNNNNNKIDDIKNIVGDTLYEIFQFVKDKRNNKKGVFVAIGNEKGFRIGCSKVNKSAGDVFKKNTALELARQQIANRKTNIPYSFREFAQEFEKRCERYFKSHKIV
jgi:hypothetical protein